MASPFDFIQPAVSLAGGIFGAQEAGGAAPLTPLPNFITDPAFARTQGQLEEFGGGILRGQIPEVAAPLVDPFSPQAEAVLSRALGDVSTGVQESLARSGTARSGLAPAIIARQQGRVSEDFRFKGLQQALQGRQNLLGQALGVTGDVARRGLEFGRQENIFNLDRFRLAEQQRTGAEGERQAQIGRVGGLFGQAGSILSGALGGIGGGGATPLQGSTVANQFFPGLAGGGQSAFGGLNQPTLGDRSFPGTNLIAPNIQPPPLNIPDLTFLQGLPRAA